jgi:hypothetical protein
LPNASCAKLNTVQTRLIFCAAWSRSTLRLTEVFQIDLICINAAGRETSSFQKRWLKKSNKGKYYVDILQESYAHLRGSGGWCGALRNADFSRTFGNIRHCVVY